jgi:hypothetical protein
MEQKLLDRIPTLLEAVSLACDISSQSWADVENVIKLQTDVPVTKTKFGAKSYKDVLVTGGSRYTAEEKK